MTYEYKVRRVMKGSGTIEDSEPFTELGQALQRAESWHNWRTVRSIIIFRADKTGINAGKFFIHQIKQAS